MHAHQVNLWCRTHDTRSPRLMLINQHPGRWEIDTVTILSKRDQICSWILEVRSSNMVHMHFIMWTFMSPVTFLVKPHIFQYLFHYELYLNDNISSSMDTPTCWRSPIQSSACSTPMCMAINGTSWSPSYMAYNNYMYIELLYNEISYGRKIGGLRWRWHLELLPCWE